MRHLRQRPPSARTRRGVASAVRRTGGRRASRPDVGRDVRPRPRHGHGPRVLLRGRRARPGCREPAGRRRRGVDARQRSTPQGCILSASRTSTRAGTPSTWCSTSSLAIKVPDGLPHRMAALTEPLAVGVHAVAKSAIAPGDAAIVIGLGPVGLACIAAMKLLGIGPIIGADFSPARRALAEHLGCRRGRRPHRGDGDPTPGAASTAPSRSSCSKPSVCPG